MVPRNAPDVISEANLAHAAREWGRMKASAAEKSRSEPEERCLPSASMSGITKPAGWAPPHNRGLGNMHVCVAFAAGVKNPLSKSFNSTTVRGRLSSLRSIRHGDWCDEIISHSIGRGRSGFNESVEDVENSFSDRFLSLRFQRPSVNKPPKKRLHSPIEFWLCHHVARFASTTRTARGL